MNLKKTSGTSQRSKFGERPRTLPAASSMSESSEKRDETSWQQSIYNQLHEIAQRALARETPGHSLQPTLLVNDAFLKLLEQKNVDAADRSQVMAVGANIIRRLLVDYARTRKAKKRGGADGRGIPLEISVADSAKTLDVLELHDVLEQLAERKPRAAQVVELRFFGGLEGEEIAEHLGISIGTVNNDWRYAKAWLYREMSSESDDA